MLRKFLDEKVAPHFHKGGKLEKLYPFYEANDTLIYTPGEVTTGATHVRDAIDLKRMMTMVIVALIPCIFMALYNTGYQAQKIIAVQGDAFVVPEGFVDGWRYWAMDAMGVDYRSGGGAYFSRILPCCVHGALFFIPVWFVGLFVGGHCEVVFALIRGHEINEGFLVTSMLYPLTLPATIPLWQVALGIAFGVIIGKEIFGGTGYNFLNVALTARAFLYFAYPKQISGNAVWTAVDGYTGATGLGSLAEAEAGTVASVIGETQLTASGNTWMECFIGNMHGSMGETSAIACLIGAAILIFTRVGSWRIMAGLVIGMTLLSSLLCVIPVLDKPVYNITPWWHLVLGGFAFGTVFMATDPVSASMTQTGKWIYGGLIGFMTVLVRSINPAFPEGIMLAILFGNVFAPLIDYYVVQANVKRRAARYAAG